MKKTLKLNKGEETNLKKIKMWNWKLIAIAIMLASLIFTGTSLAKYKKTIDLATITVTVEPEMATYTITGDHKILLKQPLTSTSEVTATRSNTGASTVTGSFNITPNGVYINDTSSTANFWLYYDFVESDGYTSAFDTSHVYYARCENKITSIEEADDIYFNFGFMNLKHNINGTVKSYGIPVIRSRAQKVTTDYKVLSAWGFPKTHTDRTAGGITYPGDYMDSLQIGSASGSILSCYTKNLMVLDLTAIFGEGNEPSQTWCDQYIKYDSTTVTWFALKEQARLNGTEAAYPAATALTTLSLEQEVLEDTTTMNLENESINEEQSLTESVSETQNSGENSNNVTNNINTNSEEEGETQNINIEEGSGSQTE